MSDDNELVRLRSALRSGLPYQLTDFGSGYLYVAPGFTASDYIKALLSSGEVVLVNERYWLSENAPHSRTTKEKLLGLAHQWESETINEDGAAESRLKCAAELREILKRETT
jgi:hypothetical protein